MTPDFAKMVEHIEKAKAELQEAMALFATPERVVLNTAYMMGHLRCLMAGCDSLNEFILDVKKKEKKAAPSKAPTPKAS